MQRYLGILCLLTALISAPADAVEWSSTRHNCRMTVDNDLVVTEQTDPNSPVVFLAKSLDEKRFVILIVNPNPAQEAVDDNTIRNLKSGIMQGAKESGSTVEWRSERPSKLDQLPSYDVGHQQTVGDIKLQVLNRFCPTSKFVYSISLISHTQDPHKDEGLIRARDSFQFLKRPALPVPVPVKPDWKENPSFQIGRIAGYVMVFILAIALLRKFTGKS